MKQHKDYNNKVTALRKLTDPLKLKKGEVKVFIVNGIKYDRKYKDRLKIPASVIVPAKDTIMVNGEPMDIASIRSIGAKDTIRLHVLKFMAQRAGTIRLTGGVAQDQLMYEYLTLCNYNGSNPNRDVSKRNIFTLVDPAAKATTARSLRKLINKATNLALNMTDAEVTTFAGASGWTVTDLGITRNQIESMAENAPENFIKFASNRSNNIKADISRAISEGIITFDGNKSQLTWTANGELILNIPRSSAGGYLDGILNFILNTEIGESVYDEIKLILNGDDVVEVKTAKKLETVSPNPKKDKGDVKPVIEK